MDILFGSKERKRRINNILCPICKASLDGGAYIPTGIMAVANLSCSRSSKDDNHFKLILNWREDDESDFINYVSEEIRIFKDRLEYIVIKQYKDSEVTWTTIGICKADYLTGQTNQLIHTAIAGDIIPFDNFNQENLISKIETAVLFQ